MKTWSLVAAAATAAAMAAASSPAAAQWYVSGSGMYVMTDDSDLTDSSLPGVTGTLSANDGGGFTFALGYSWNMGLRAEFEGAYRNNGLDRLTLRAFGLTATGAASGETSVWSGMANAYYDFKTSSPFTPYVGAGLGFANVNVDITVAGVNANSEDTTFAYQLMGGVKYALTREIDLRMGYRYFALDDPQFGTTTGTYHSHNIEFGASYKF